MRFSVTRLQLVTGALLVVLLSGGLFAARGSLPLGVPAAQAARPSAPAAAPNPQSAIPADVSPAASGGSFSEVRARWLAQSATLPASDPTDAPARHPEP